LLLDDKQEKEPGRVAGFFLLNKPSELPLLAVFPDVDRNRRNDDDALDDLLPIS
jgi:hypothetical protein